MPHYRINIKLENDQMREYVIDDFRKDIDIVYLDFRRRTYEKNGAGRVTYFDLVMIAEESLKHQEERIEVLNPSNDIGIINSQSPQNRYSKKKREASNSPFTLADRIKVP